MRYSSLRRQQLQTSNSVVFPLNGKTNWREDYSLGYTRGSFLGKSPTNYFFRNLYWKRTKKLFSHTKVHWSSEKRNWVVFVFFVRNRNFRIRRNNWFFIRSKLDRSRDRYTRRILFLWDHLTRLPQKSYRRLSLPRRFDTKVVVPVGRDWKLPKLQQDYSLLFDKNTQSEEWLLLSKYHKWIRLCKVFNRKRKAYLTPQKDTYEKPFRVSQWNRHLWIKQKLQKLYQSQMTFDWGTPRGGAHWKWRGLPGVTCGTLTTVLARVKYRLGSARTEIRARRLSRPILKLTQKLPGGVSGVEIRCNGRFTRKQRSSHEVFQVGYLNRTHLGTPVQEDRLTLALRFGAVSLSVLVTYLFSYSKK